MPLDVRVGVRLVGVYLVGRGGPGRRIASVRWVAPSRLAVRAGRPSRPRLPEVVADELALLGQQLVEVLVDVRLADRLGGQVQVLDLLELACVGRLRILRVVWDSVRAGAVRDGGGVSGVVEGGGAGRARRVGG